MEKDGGLVSLMKRLLMFVLVVVCAQARGALRDGYVGDAACQSCHTSESETYHHTAHFLTSSAPGLQSIFGDFAVGGNVLKTVNPNLSFLMEAKGDGFYQTSVAGNPPHTRSERFAVVVGSGEKGQTYLFWDEDLLFQLPVSFWKDLGWVNSPGYRDGFADFERAIIPRCLECHASYIEALPPPSNRYKPASVVLGIGCEKCHGPGREHVAWEKTKPVTGSTTHILNPGHLARDRQMDLCAWCHAGHGQPLKPSFSYLPGEPLDAYLRIPASDPNSALDVHGNQVEMLKRSRCYLGSAMTCLTCHNVHAAQHDLADFSQRCLTCHKPDSATFTKTNHPLTKNCIDCHMPRQETNLIVFDWKGKTVKPQVRNHWIKVY